MVTPKNQEQDLLQKNQKTLELEALPLKEAPQQPSTKFTCQKGRKTKEETRSLNYCKQLIRHIFASIIYKIKERKKEKTRPLTTRSTVEAQGRGGFSLSCVKLGARLEVLEQFLNSRLPGGLLGMCCPFATGVSRRARQICLWQQSGRNRFARLLLLQMGLPILESYRGVEAHINFKQLILLNIVYDVTNVNIGYVVENVLPPWKSEK